MKKYVVELQVREFDTEDKSHSQIMWFIPYLVTEDEVVAKAQWRIFKRLLDEDQGL